MQCTTFGQNPSFGLRDMVQTSCCGSKFDIQSGGVTLKMRSRSPKSNHSFLCPTGVYMQDWSKSTYWFRRYFVDKPYNTPANFVCGGVYCFHVVCPSVRQNVRHSVRPSVCPSLTLCFFSNILKISDGYSSISANTLISIRYTYIRKSKG